MKEEILGVAYFAPIFRMTGKYDYQVYITGQMKNGKRHGVWKYLSEDASTLLKKQEYEDGILRNEEIFTTEGENLECIAQMKSEQEL